MIPKYLYHKIFGGNTHPDFTEVRTALSQISKEGLVPLVAREWANLVPEHIRDLPIVWLSETIGSNKGIWLWINTTNLDANCLFKLDIKDVEWWVYQGIIPNFSVERIEDNIMVHEEITYEQSLEMMNEEGLRTECIRLKNKLDMIHVQQLTQTVPIKKMSKEDKGARPITMFPGEKEAVLDSIGIAARYGYGNLISHLKRVQVMKLMAGGLSKEVAIEAAGNVAYKTDFLGLGESYQEIEANLRKESGNEC